MNEKLVIKSQRSSFSFIYIVIVAIYIIISYILYACNDGYTTLFTWLGYLFPVVLICILLIYTLTKCEITVTDKRVYGKAAFGKRVDLPIDKVSAVGTSYLKGVSVATSSGSIKFFMIGNNNEIHNEISKLLLNRQENKQDEIMSNADELKKYKELLDMGAITQEEFDAKKKEILGL